MKLSDLKENEQARIDFIDDKLEIKRRLTELGFVRGQGIRCCNVSLVGSPIAYKICGTKLALRRGDAERIGVIL